MPEPAAAVPLFRRAFAVAVGLFATWQLVYLPAANLIDFVPRRQRGPELEPIYDTYQAKGSFTEVEAIQRAAEWTGDVLDFWSEASGQEQGWSLFAPGAPPYSVIPAVEFRFADGTSDTMLSPYEPTDKLNPRIRLALVNNRPFNFEAQFIYPVWYAPPEEIARLHTSPEQLARLTESYRDLPDTVRAWQKPIRVWLAWRWKDYRAAHPDRGTPTELILKHRYIPTPKPNEPRGWTQPPHERPFARWKPADGTFDAYDAVNKRFVPVEVQP
jgi:hypothetical protein